jgi:hypothetical protein
MNPTTKKTIKAGLRIFEFFLLVLLVMTMIELMLMYKGAHDHPEDYVQDRPRPQAAAPTTNAAPARPPAMAPAAPAPGMRTRQQPNNRPMRPGRRQGAQPAQPQPGGGGGDNRPPSVFSFTRIRNQVSVFLVNFPDEAANTNRMTNLPPAELTTTNGAPMEATGGNRGVGFLATEFIRPHVAQNSGRDGTDSGPAFRFAIP